MHVAKMHVARSGYNPRMEQLLHRGSPGQLILIFAPESMIFFSLRFTRTKGGRPDVQPTDLDDDPTLAP